MLFWTTGNVPFLFFQMIMMVLWFINIAKIVTCGLWINVNSGLFIFLHRNPCIAGKHRRPFYWPRTTGNQTILFHIWLMVGPKFLLSWVERICQLIITTSPTDLNRYGILTTWDLVRPCETSWDLVRPCETSWDSYLEVVVRWLFGGCFSRSYVVLVWSSQFITLKTEKKNIIIDKLT